MPCSDLSETVEVSFDAEDRLLRFELRKATCGAPLRLRSLERLVGLTIDELQHDALPRLRSALLASAEDRLLRLKGLDALGRALAVLTGCEAGGADRPLAIQRIEHDQHGTRLTGLLAVAIDGDDVPPCGDCCRATG